MSVSYTHLDKGIGNGISILLFVGIVARFPQIGMTIFSYFAQGGWYILLMAAVIVLLLAMIVFIVVVTNAERRIPVQYAKRMVGRKTVSYTHLDVYKRQTVRRGLKE